MPKNRIDMRTTDQQEEWISLLSEKLGIKRNEVVAFALKALADRELDSKKKKPFPYRDGHQ